MRTKVTSAAAAAALVVILGGAGCAGFRKTHAVSGVEDKADHNKLVRLAIEMLQPTNTKYNPDKGKAYLDYVLRSGSIRQVELPAPVIIELLRSERIASEKSRNLEQQLEIMKEIDLNREESL